MLHMNCMLAWKWFRRKYDCRTPLCERETGAFERRKKTNYDTRTERVVRMKLAIFGAAGRTGILLLQQALERRTSALWSCWTTRRCSTSYRFFSERCCRMDYGAGASLDSVHCLFHQSLDYILYIASFLIHFDLLIGPSPF